MKKYLTLLVSGLFCFSGCGGDGSAICNALSKCGINEAECEMTFDALILPEGCEEAIIEADCEDHHVDPPPYSDTCFPPCGEDSAQCNGDIITACYQEKTMISRCPEACKLVNKNYTGVCADEYQGQVSETGMDVCWCQ